MKHVIRPAARDDILRQFRYYLLEEQSPEAAMRFLDAVDKTIRQVRQMPRMGAPKVLGNRSLDGLRSLPVRGFGEIGIYYLVSADTLRVIRVLHGKRDVQRILEKERGEESG